MIRPLKFVLFACLMTLGLLSQAAEGPSTEGPSTEVAPFLKEQGLEKYHAACVKFFAALAAARPETAAKILADSAGVPQERLPDGMKRLVVTAAAKFNDGVIDIESVGFSRISSRAIAIYFMAHTQREPQLFILMAYRRKETWNTYMWTYECDAAKILELMKGANRFSGDTVLSMRNEDKAA